MLETSELFDPKSAHPQTNTPFTGMALDPFSRDLPGGVAASGIYQSEPSAFENPDESILPQVSVRETVILEEFTRFFPEFSRHRPQAIDPLETLRLQLIQAKMAPFTPWEETDSQTEDHEVVSVTLDRITHWQGEASDPNPTVTLVPEHSVAIATESDPESAPGNSLNTAIPIQIDGVESGETHRGLQFQPNQTLVGQVNPRNPEDFYRFTLDRPGILTAEITNLTGDVDLRLIKDFNGNGIVDPVADRNGNGVIDPEEIEVIAWQPNRGTLAESIRQFLPQGTYTLQAVAFNQNSANYTLTTNFTPMANDPKPFAIELNFGAGTQTLTNDHRNTIRKAADRIEQMISHSPFEGPHTITVDVEALDFGPGFVASAGPKTVRRLDTVRIPVSGQVTFNPNPLSDLLAYPHYLYSTIVHELAHVVGFGTLWEDRNLIANAQQGLYDAKTFAGQMYGEMLGTFVPTPVELTVNVGEGSDLGHWRKNPYFDNEIGVEAGHPDEHHVTSTLTIASLRDLGWTVNYGAAEEYSLPQFRSKVA